MTTRLSVPTDGPWQAALTVASRLIEQGFETYYAGGCVRDCMLGLPVHDVDIATAATPEQVERLFEHSIAVGKQFGIIVVVVGDGQQVEVATFRSDGVYVDGRTPSSVTFATAQQDVQRRDFTINALLMDPLTGAIHDYVGGQADLAQRLLRTVGDAAARLREDRLRVLRALRFCARLHLTMEAATWRAICSTTLDGLSAERIWQEFDKATSDPNAETWCRLLVASGHHRALLPTSSALWDAQAVGAAQGAVHRESLAVRLAAWLWPLGPLAVPSEQWLKQQPLPAAVVRDVIWLMQQRHAASDIVAWRRCALDARATGLHAIMQGFAPATAHDRAAVDACTSARAWVAAHPGLIVFDGHALQRLGVAAGPAMGRIMRRLNDHQLAGSRLDRTQAEALVRAWLAGMDAPVR